MHKLGMQNADFSQNIEACARFERLRLKHIDVLHEDESDFRFVQLLYILYWIQTRVHSSLIL